MLTVRGDGSTAVTMTATTADAALTVSATAAAFVSNVAVVQTTRTDSTAFYLLKVGVPF